jgi:hypothetical protein
MTETTETIPRWWGRYEVPPGPVLRWRIGPLTLRVQRQDHEWRIATDRGTDPLDASLELGEVDAEGDLRETPGVLRLGMGATAPALHLQPRLADRAVVTRPDQPFRIPPHEAVTLYVSTPLWLSLHSPDLSHELHELPLYRPSDTWFGPNTRVGELSYATRTAGRLDLAEVPRRPHRAVTAVVILNRASSPLVLERLNLPVANLCLYETEGVGLWTQSLTLTRLPDEDLAPVTLAKGPPSEATDARLLIKPRVQPPDNLVIRAFAQLFR